MSTFVRRTALALPLAALLVACRPSAPVVAPVLPPPTLPPPSVASQWLAAQSAVNALLADNRAFAAESALASFARDFPRTPEGDRARWWRTLMKADNRINSGDASLAISQLDSLIADSVAIEVRSEAILMRRSLSAIDSLRRTEARRRTTATQLATDRLDELKVARDSMAKLSAEIMRLRRRLRSP